MDRQEELKICNRCGGTPNIRLIKDRNMIGNEMYKASALCTSCGKQIIVFRNNPNKAIEEIIKLWNGVTK